MRNNSTAARVFSALSLLLIVGFIVPAFGLTNAAPDNSNSGPTNNANTSNTSGTPQENKNAANGNRNAGGDSQNANTSNGGGGAATGGATQGAAGGAAQPTATQLLSAAQSVKDLKVTGVVTRFNAPKKEPEDEAGLYNTIRVKVQNLAQWAQNPANHADQFILYVNGYPLKGVRGRPDSEDDNYLLFDLRRTDDPSTQASWRDILNRPKLLWPAPRPSHVSIGYLPDPNQPEVVRVSGSATLKLVDVNSFWFFVFIAFLIAAFIVFMLFAVFSSMIRDPGPDDARVKRWNWHYRRPFSLGRTQMAFWFFIIIASYVFIWMVTGDGDTITGTVLGLMGISATTALGSVLIDNSKTNQANSLEAERQSLTERIAELEAKAQASPPQTTQDEAQELNAKRTRLNEIDLKQPPPAAAATPAPRTTDGFFMDILSDADGVSFHRFQIVAWTVALGFIFLAQVFNSLTMPDFNGTLLALMGISSGTYLGFKFPEKQS